MTTRSAYWLRVYDNAVAKGATDDQATRLADAVVKAWKPNVERPYEHPDDDPTSPDFDPQPLDQESP